MHLFLSLTLTYVLADPGEAKCGIFCAFKVFGLDYHVMKRDLTKMLMYLIK